MLRRMPIRCNPQRMGEQPKRRTGGHVARVVRIEQTGGPEVMRWIDMDLPAPGPGEVRIRTTAVGLNFIDIYHRRGDYRSEEHTSELQSLMRISYAVFCLKKKKTHKINTIEQRTIQHTTN